MGVLHFAHGPVHLGEVLFHRSLDLCEGLEAESIIEFRGREIRGKEVSAPLVAEIHSAFPEGALFPLGERIAKGELEEFVVDVRGQYAHWQVA